MNRPDEHVDPQPATDDPRRRNLAPEPREREKECEERKTEPPGAPADSEAPDRPIVRPPRRRPPPLIDPRPRPRR